MSKGYNFNKVENIFNEYINTLFEFKKTSKGSLKLIFKSLLNNLVGRLGLSLIKPITKTVSDIQRDYIFNTRKIHSYTILNENKYLITYDPIISKDICEQHGLDIMEVLKKESKYSLENSLDAFKDVSIATAAMVNSYARIHMNKIKLEILNNNGKIYYSDTDSLVVDRDYFRANLNNLISPEIGKFKLEYQIKEGYFISNKTYCLVLNNGEIIIKAKGVIKNSLTLDDFKSMY